MTADPAAVAALMHAILTERGPLTDEELLDALTAAQAPMGDDPAVSFDRLMLWDDLGPVLPLLDDRQCWLPAVLGGRVFTHRVDERELAYDLLRQTPDLGFVGMLTEDPDGLGLDGTPLPTVVADSELPGDREIPRSVLSAGGDFLLPPGTLAGLELKPGDLIGVRVTADRLTLERIEDVTPPPAGLQATIESFLDADDFESIEMLVPTLCSVDDGLFRSPLPPVGELLNSMGFAQDGDRIAFPGFDFEAALFDNRIRLIQDRHGLEENEATALAQLESLFSDVEQLARQMEDREEAEPQLGPETESESVPFEAPEISDQDEQSIAEITSYLVDTNIAGAFLDDTVYVGRGSPASLAALAGGLEQQASREARAPLRWLQARAYEHMGDLEAAEKTLDEAEGLDPGWPLTLLDLARYASDRGDATRALGLLRRAGSDEEDRFLSALRRYQPMPRPDMRRNAPCWCGSGRKYKACHLNNEQLPLAERAGWLYEKACSHLRTADWTTKQLSLADVRVADGSEEAFVAAVFDPFVTDVLLVEGGGFEDFFVRRGDLLPEDERDLAERWLAVQRSVYEVVDVRPGRGMTLQDVVTRDRSDVDLQETGDLTSGALVCGRLLPVEGAGRCFGGLEPVARDDVAAVLEAVREQDPVMLIEAVSA